jgi:hypothetical protein
MFAGLAYLVRPEGMGLLLPAFIYLIVCRKTRLRAGGRIAGIVMAGLACLIVASPYLGYLNREAGGRDLILTQKKSLSHLIGLGKKPAPGESSPSSVSAPEDPLETMLYTQERPPHPKLEQLGLTLREFLKTLGPLGLAAIIGIIMLLIKGNERWGNLWLALVAGLYGLVVLFVAINIYNWNTPSQRHVLPIVTLCLIWAGFGLERLFVWAMTALNRRKSSAWVSALPVICLVLIFAGLWATMLRPRRQEQLGQLCAARIIREQGVPSPIIMCNEEKIPYYAHGQLKSLPPFTNAQVTGEALAAYARAKKVNFIVIKESDAKKSFKFFDPDAGYDKEHFELLNERADEACVKRMFGVKVALGDTGRYLIYRVK